jgi:hypothetical protein
MPLIGDPPLRANQAAPSVGRGPVILLVVAVAAVAVVLWTARAHHGTTSTSVPASAGYCSLVNRYKTSVERLSAASQPGDLAARSAAVSSDLDRAAAAAPPEIKPDMDAFARAYEQAARTLSGTSDGSVVTGAFQALNSPDLEARLARIASYDKRVCAVG